MSGALKCPLTSGHLWIPTCVGMTA